jgi:hypothetical protein
MTKFFKIYQYVVPVILVPLSYYIWLRTFGGDHRKAILVSYLPVVFSYVAPWLGIKVFRLWRLSLKSRIRPHHGFVLGSGASFMAWLCYIPGRPETVLFDTLRFAFTFGSTFALWSWIYDIYAIKTGFIIHFTREAYEKKSVEEMTFAYAPLVFGTFAFCIGLSFKFFEYWKNTNPVLDTLAWIAAAVFSTATPLIVYMTQYYIRHGNLGLRSYENLMAET